jgi:hypothetical protein
MAFPPISYMHIIKLLISNFVQPSAFSFHLVPNIPHSTLGLCSSLDVREQVSHQYTTAGNITVLYDLNMF